MLYVVRGLPGAIDYDAFCNTLTKNVVSPWLEVNVTDMSNGTKKYTMISSEEWRRAHENIREQISNFFSLGLNESLAVWFEYDKFYHLVELRDIVQKFEVSMCVLDVFDNGYENVDLLDRCSFDYKGVITSKYLNHKRSSWHFHWKRQK